MTVDDRPYEANPGQLVIDACELAGAYVPRFCYHPRMRPVGMCRQCLVEIEGPRGPMMVVSCMTPVAEGQVVRTATPGIKRAQEGVLELLLANHPLDCPVCDKGGECPLQDQAYTHGPGESRYVEEKRHFEKPIPISSLVNLDRERCILCDRCTRFADEVAGDALISFTHRGNETQVLTFPDEPFSSYFSGNTVQICPVGALTSAPYRFKARPWDLDQVESTCTTCSVGCRMVVQSSRDELVRYHGVDSDPVNWSWLCDRGRFNFEAVNSEHRLGEPLVRGEGGLRRDDLERGDDRRRPAASREAVAGRGPDGIAVLGGARGTNEDAFAWARLADALGVANRDAQVADGLPAELLSLPRATIDEAAAARTVVLLGPDLKEELPVLYLRLRHAAEERTDPDPRARPDGQRADPLRLAQHPRGVRRRRRLRRALSDYEVADQLAVGPGRHRRRPRQPRRVRRRRQPRCWPRCSRPARAPRCCRHCVAATSSARCSSAWRRRPDRPRRRRDPDRRRRGSHRRARAARRRPARRLPGRRPGPPGAGRRPPHHRRRRVPDRVVPAGRRRPARRRVR